MTKTRKHYEASFKANAVKLSYERNNLSELARELGIEATLIYRWRKEYSQYAEGSFPGNGKQKQTAEEKQIAEMEAALRRKDMEIEILKKALGIISKSNS